MTKIQFGEQFDHSKASYDISTSSESTTEISVGSQHDKSERQVNIRDDHRNVLPSTTITILFVASNPLTTERLELDEEFRGITQSIQMSRHRESFLVVPVLAARPEDLLPALNTHRPEIVHFSGHGTRQGDLLFAGEQKNSQVSLKDLGRVLASAPKRIQLTFFNACHSEAEIRALERLIPCSISMKEEVLDDAAKAFSTAFYGAIASGGSVLTAFDQGQAAVGLAGLGPSPAVLSCGKGVDAKRVVFTGLVPKPASR